MARLCRRARLAKREAYVAWRDYVQQVVTNNELAPKPERDPLSRNEARTYVLTHTKGFRDPQRKLLSTPKEFVIKSR